MRQELQGLFDQVSMLLFSDELIDAEKDIFNFTFRILLNNL